MAERRGNERKGTAAGGSAKPPKRRMGDRRDSTRVACDLRVRRPGQARFETFSGDLGLGGARVLLQHPPFGTEVEVGLKLPGVASELRLLGKVIRVTGGGGKYNAHIQFGELPVNVELAIARFLDGSSPEDEV